MEHLSEYGGKVVVAALTVKNLETIMPIPGVQQLVEDFEALRPAPEHTTHVIRYVYGTMGVCVDLARDGCDVKWVRRLCRPNAKVSVGGLLLLLTGTFLTVPLIYTNRKYTQR